MTSASPGSVRGPILEALKDPCSAAQLAARLGRIRPVIDNAIGRMRTHKDIHICRYTVHEKRSQSLVPIYAVGDKPNARPPRGIYTPLKGIPPQVDTSPQTVAERIELHRKLSAHGVWAGIFSVNVDDLSSTNLEETP